MRYRFAGVVRQRTHAGSGRATTSITRRRRGSRERDCSAASRSLSPKLRRGSATVSRTVIFGLREACGSWNTIWMLRRTSRMRRPLTAAQFSPWNQTAPVLGPRSRTITRPRVDLPQPEFPDETEGLATGQGEANTVDRAQLTVPEWSGANGKDPRDLSTASTTASDGP